jgi:phenylalanyl-tRNA synthetase alpha chain
MSLLQQLDQIEQDLDAQSKTLQSIDQIQDYKDTFFGKKGRISQVMQQLKQATAEEKPLVGQKVNALKQAYLSSLDQKVKDIEAEALNQKLAQEAVDITLPADRPALGHMHPIQRAEAELVDICASLGFSVASGPIIEDEFHNFEALNIPPTHPSRDMHDTFYLSNQMLLRTHTSSVQIRYAKTHQPPIKIVAPGNVFRCDADRTHSPMFHQLEGLYIDTNVTLPQLKYCLQTLLNQFFNNDLPMRYRSSYFPFTEPSFEVDVSFSNDNTEWMEVLGAGMVHHNVLRSMGYNPEEVSGFAFGLGIDRLAMLKYGIRDIRAFYENDTRFLTQGGTAC